MSPIRAYHHPRGCRPPTRSHCAGGVDLEVTRASEEQWTETIWNLRRARERLRRRSVDDILAVLQQAFVRWHRPDSPQRRIAEEALPLITGFSAPMIRYGLPRILAPLHVDSLRNLLAAELGATPQRRPISPALVVHVLAGNIPGLGAISTHLSLAIGSAAILKTATGDPLSAALWAQTIAEVDPELGDCLAVTYWPGGNIDTETAAFGAADLVVASGSDAAIDAIAARVRGRFRGHGHRISFAVIGRECLDQVGAAALARALARDVTLWDQQGCLSPQVCYVEAGGGVDPQDFAAMLAAALAADAEELPPRRLDLDEQVEVLRFRQVAEWEAETTLLASKNSTAWSVTVEKGTDLRPTCLNRCIRVKVISSLEEIAAALVHHRHHLEAAGIAVQPERREDLGRALADTGVHHICPIGRMQEPPLSWCQGGRPRVADWVEWMEADDRDV